MSSKREKKISKNHCYKVNQMLLSLFHLWPYQQLQYAIINHTVNLIIIVSFLFFQLTSLLTYQLTADFLIMLLSYTVPSLISIIQYYSFYIKTDAVKQILKDISDSWSALRNGAEHNIMQKYSFAGQKCTTVISLSVLVCLILYAFLQFLPSILDIILPLNETRPRQSYAITEYFVDKSRYYNLLLCHWLVGIFFNFFIVTATTTLHLVYVEHICGMLSVVSYRIYHAIDNYTSYNHPKKENRVISQNISVAVDLHRKALKCSSFLSTTFAVDFFLIMVLGILSLSLNLFRLLKVISVQRNIIDLFSSVILVSAHFLIMFLDNYFGQKLTDHNTKIFYDIYNIQWYTVPVRIQKMFLFVMQSTTKPHILNIGNLIMASIEGFAKLMSMSISYFTVLYALQ